MTGVCFLFFLNLFIVQQPMPREYSINEFAVQMKTHMQLTTKDASKRFVKSGENQKIAPEEAKHDSGQQQLSCWKKPRAGPGPEGSHLLWLSGARRKYKAEGKWREREMKVAWVASDQSDLKGE